jgi:hypothetical protein
MRWAPLLLGLLTLAAACVVEDKQLVPPIEGGVEAGVCVLCPEDKPVCLDDVECVQCTSEERGYCTNRNQVCDTEAHVCVECLDNTQCTAANASRCDTDNDECAPCETNTDCDGVDGLASSGNACTADGVCVECTPDSEAQTCPANRSCNPRTNTCTDTIIGSRAQCEPCVADSECGDEGEPSDAYKCVPMYYPDAQTRFPDAETGFCLKRTDGGCQRPYAITLVSRPTLSAPSSTDDYCGINEALATCPAVAALVADERCPNGTDEECEISGICRQVGNLQNRCTYFCTDVVECKEAPVPGSTCGSSGSGGDDYCGG